MKIVKGSDTILNVQLIEKSTKEPLSLAGFTSASAYFAGDPVTPVAATGTLVSADLGKLSFVLSDVFTATMKAGDEMDIEVHVNQGVDKTIVQIIGKLEVAAQLF